MNTDFKYAAEYLPRIGCISIVVEGLEDLCVQKLQFNDTTSILEVSNNSGTIYHIKLPYIADATMDISSIKYQKNGPNEYVLRLPINSIEKLKRVNLLEMDDELEGLWSKKQLLSLSDFNFCCIKCQNIIISKSNSFKINQMPSEYWMELMDYWHCHKPDDKSVAGQRYSVKYNGLQPNINELLVGGSFFLGQSNVFHNIKMDRNIIRCKTCNTLIGEKTTNDLAKIHKWKLQLLARSSPEFQLATTYPPEYSVNLSLINFMKSNSTRYTLLRCSKSGYDYNILVWLFGVGLNISFTNGIVLKNTLKIFYQKIIKDNEEFSEVQARLGGNVNIEELAVDATPFEEFIRNLEYNSQFLPANLQSMRDWQISYLSI
ncbi:hypothetical protein TBLA_0E04920 [Henningerozyma blattae CBS 6284]|uniref:Ubiquitin-conjugating enzyme E2C-binding protein n=1 Tax=Henningerozyma blattae (strain ATCC 34711 / CBS 6284 / DSM 70876 / NBRC 10599 / NRRL Y-10934 / UCD 77-7) TaxID=1071380 RepID=I2H589_HENB6|nr:hypothetical protein TBLA_0E04920 [Tetrapisispora blattae CBS 6284]CCH61541.1 hypothetical protein TBLA_0E04920 [Tetrapisispora blattae CBS 6284]